MSDAENTSDTGALEDARARLYRADDGHAGPRQSLSVSGDRVLPHAWQDTSLRSVIASGGNAKHVRFAGIFFGFAVIFFIVSVLVAGYFFYFGGNTVSSDKIRIELEGPTTIAGGDTVPLQLTIVNRNPTALDDATIEITFPESTRDADNTLEAYPRYVENLGRIESGATVTRSLRAVLFGGAGQTVTLPIAFTYNTQGSRDAFTKKSSYSLGISTTPLELSVGTLSETVSGKPLTLTLMARSNSTVPLSNVAIVGAFPFGFSVTSSSVPLTNSSFLLGTLAPGESKTVTLTGTLAGQNSEQRVFRFNVGTTKSATDPVLAVTYMSQEANVNITAPFITTTLAVNGDSTQNAVITAGAPQSVTVSYANTLPSNIANVVVNVAISGSAVDYDSISTTRGFYRSVDRTVVFSQDTDPSLGTLAPGASGLGTFSFKTLGVSAGATSPSVNFTVSVAGTRIGQSNVPESIQATMTRTLKVRTAVAFSASALHASGPISNTGPIPPRPNQQTTYSVVWDVSNQGSAVADGVVTALLPSYVTYTGKTAGAGSFSYDSSSRKVTWNAGNIGQGSRAQGVFQVALTPSTSQINSAPQLTAPASFTGYDRFAGVAVNAGATPATTETKGDPGYVSGNGNVQQ